MPCKIPRRMLVKSRTSQSTLVAPDSDVLLDRIQMISALNALHLGTRRRTLTISTVDRMNQPKDIRDFSSGKARMYSQETKPQALCGYLWPDLFG
mmetsp:Transcript_29488/g.81030  ORF Transcript_29488/g.81030 Transcript_29488/m.81030 type:complete len:95 (+) Transcript_29488:1029-1313(+)